MGWVFYGLPQINGEGFVQIARRKTLKNAIEELQCHHKRGSCNISK